MKRENHWMMRLFILLFSISVSVAIVPCGVVNVYGALGEVYSSITIETEKETQFVKAEVSKEKGINAYNVWFILFVTVLYIAFVEYSIRLPRGDTIVSLKVRMDN